MTVEYDLHDLMFGQGKQTNFNTMLIKLIFKADNINKERIRAGFPHEVEVVERYIETGVDPLMEGYNGQESDS
jgi:hypothetical protein